MAHLKRAGQRDFGGAGAQPQYPPDLQLEPRHIELDLTFNLEAQTLLGEATTTVEASVDGPITLVLDAIDFEDLRVVGDEGEAVSFDYDGKKIHVSWKRPFDAKESRRVHVRYKVVRPITGLIFSKPDDHYPNRCLYAATDHETERARYWLPCIDLPAVRTTFDLKITAASALTILASGTDGGTVNNGNGTQTATWKLDHPCPSYLLCIALGDFCRFDDESVDGVPISYFGPRVGYDPEDLRRSFGRTPQMMRWLTQRLDAPFPFSKYYQFALPGIWGAMENISLVSWDASHIHDETRFREAGVGVDATNIHEMAHSYFGDAIVIRDHSHSWLKESWATYIETVYWEETEGLDEGLYDLWCSAQSYFREADHRYVRPITTRKYESSWQMFDMHTYPGGACRIHMLRALIGDDAFWAATRDYIATYSKDVVETDDFRRVLEKHSGRSLQRFFDQWIESPGYLQIKADFSFDAEEEEGVFTLEQTQVDKEAGVGLFEMDLDLWWEDEEGEQHRRTVLLDGAKKTAVIPMKTQPQQVRVDPDAKLLMKLEFDPGTKLLRRQLTQASDIWGRILAVRTLIESGKRGNFEAVRKAFFAEPFYGVRIEMAKAMGGANSEDAIAALVEWLPSEGDPRVLGSLAAACSRYRDPRIASALRTFLEREDLGYGIRGGGLNALAEQRDPADLETITVALDQADWNGVLGSGALRALGRTRTAQAIALLAKRIDYGQESDWCRHHAVRALADSLQWSTEPERGPYLTQLRDLTRDPMERVRLATADALASLEVSAAIPDIERMKTLFAPQDHPDLDEIIAGLRSSEKGTVPEKTKKALEELRERVRKLADQLQTLEARVCPEKVE